MFASSFGCVTCRCRNPIRMTAVWSGDRRSLEHGVRCVCMRRLLYFLVVSLPVFASVGFRTAATYASI